METILFLLILILMIISLGYFIYWMLLPYNVSIIKTELKYQSAILNEINEKLSNNDNQINKE